MSSILGLGVLVITFVITINAVVTGILAARSKSQATLESARRAALVTFPLLTVVVGTLLFLLLSGRFEYTYVYQTTDLNMPLYLKITALWGGQEGSLLFWCWLLSGFAFIALVRPWKRDRDLMPWVIVVTMFTLFFFVLLVLFFENPFNRYYLNFSGEVVMSLFPPPATLPADPANGAGMNPLLRHFGMVVHPPMLYLGFVGFVIPFAYAISSLINGRADDHWIRATRKWSLVAWLFLSAGLVLGSRWAYDVLGWGGYWGWDPVEISALMPWLTGTAYLHSMMMQEKRGLFKHWNIALIILTFCLVILGTFLTRSGLLSSVHAFSQSALGPAFFIFITVVFLASLVLLLYRWSSLGSEYQIQSFFSRESLFLFNNLLFLAIFLVCLTGVLFPIFSELFTGQQVTVGPPFYKSSTGPLFGLLFLLMGIVPLSVWGTSTARRLSRELWKPALASLMFPIAALVFGVSKWTGVLAIWLVGLVIFVTVFDYARSVKVSAENNHESRWKAFNRLTSRNRRRYGGYIIHIGVVLMGLGIIGIEFFQTETQATIKPGETLEFAGYQLTYNGLEVEENVQGREVAQAFVRVARGTRDLGEIIPRHDYYYEQQQSVTIPGLRSTLKDDLYMILVDWMPISSDGATFKIFHNPLVTWLWIGSVVLLLGTVVALWPDREKKGVVERSKEAA